MAESGRNKDYQLSVTLSGHELEALSDHLNGLTETLGRVDEVVSTRMGATHLARVGRSASEPPSFLNTAISKLQSAIFHRGAGESGREPMPGGEYRRALWIIRLALLFALAVNIGAVTGVLLLLPVIIGDQRALLMEGVMTLTLVIGVYLSRRPVRMLFRDFVLGGLMDASRRVSGLTEVWARYARVSGFTMYLDERPTYEEELKDLIVPIKKLQDGAVKALRYAPPTARMHRTLSSEEPGWGKVECGEIIGPMWQTSRADYVTCQACIVAALDREGQTPDASGGEDQSDSQSESAS